MADNKNTDDGHINSDNPTKNVNYKRNKIIVHSLAGSLASMSLQMLHPFDIQKIRFQSHDGGIDSRNLVPYYRSLVNSFKIIYRQEGGGAFFKGVQLSIQGNNLSYGFFFGLYAYNKNKIENYVDNQALVPVQASFGAGSQSSLLFQPMWVLKTRRILDQEKGTDFKRVPILAREIYAQHGASGFFRGYLFTLALSFYGVFQISFYENSKLVADKFYGDQNRETPNSIIGTIGVLSRIMAGMFQHPLTTIRTRIQQNQYNDVKIADKVVPKYEGYRDIIGKTWGTEGIKGFYKGIVPMTLRSAPAQGQFFLVYEWAKKLGNKRWPMEGGASNNL